MSADETYSVSFDFGEPVQDAEHEYTPPRWSDLFGIDPTFEVMDDGCLRLSEVDFSNVGTTERQ